MDYDQTTREFLEGIKGFSKPTQDYLKAQWRSSTTSRVLGAGAGRIVRNIDGIYTIALIGGLSWIFYSSMSDLKKENPHINQPSHFSIDLKIE